MDIIPIEQHPLEPFLPKNGKVLLLGSFPPQKKRWCIDFYYPNWTNDFWRMLGVLFFQNKTHFLIEEEKKYNKELIVDFLTEKGIAIYDTASSIRRLQDNASDKFLEVVEQTDIEALLSQMPNCKTIVTTGQKATDTICKYFNIEAPKMANYVTFSSKDREVRLYRMPSSSRAYPMKLENKALKYVPLFKHLGMETFL